MEGPGDNTLSASSSSSNIDVLKLPWDRLAAVGGAVASMRARSAFTDVNLVCHDSVVVRAHQAVLASLSPMLCAIFRAHSCCSCAGAECYGASSEATLIIPWVSAQSATMLMSIIYSGRATCASDRERKELLKLIAALDMKMPREVEAALMEATRKRKAEESLTKEEKKRKECVPNSDGVFQCWRCGATYASERSHHAHSILCSKKHKRVEAEEEGVIVIEDESEVQEDVTEPKYLEARSLSISGTTRLVSTTEVTLEQIQVKEEPLDAEGHVVALHTCRYCLMVMHSRNGLLQHLCVEHFNKHLQQAYGHLTACPDCGFSAPNNTQLLIHLGVEHAKVSKYLKFCQESPEDLCCPHCDETAEDPEMLVVHLATEHYERKLKVTFPLNSKCPMCELALEEPYFYLHLIRKHFALFTVMPRRICDQLLRIMTDEMLEIRENFGTHASKAPEAVDDEVTPDINLVCPVCEKIFTIKEDLREDLAAHYVGDLKKLFGSNLGGRCPFCRKEGLDGDDGVMIHIATVHGQLRRVLPKEVARSLAHAGLMWGTDQGPAVTVSTGKTLEEIRVQQEPTSPELTETEVQPKATEHEAEETDAELIDGATADSPVEMDTTSHGTSTSQSPITGLSSRRCPGCNLVTSAHSFHRHLAIMHLQAELTPYVNTEHHQCRICHAVLSSTRIALTHVAKQHGFADRWIKDQEKLAKVRKVSNLQKVQNEEALSTGQGAETSMASIPLPSSTLSSAAASFGSVPCPFSGCAVKPFYIWSRWKKHIYFHVKDKVLAEYPQVDQQCVMCPKKFSQRFETLFHIGMVHNRIFSKLPSSLSWVLTKGLTVDPNRREYPCPMCTDGSSVIGAYPFKNHLFAHCRPRMRASFLRRGNTCLDCGENFQDYDATLKHVALEHNKFVDFLPEEVFREIEDMGVFLASKVPANKKAKAYLKQSPPPSVPIPQQQRPQITVKLPDSKLGHQNFSIASPLSDLASPPALSALHAQPLKKPEKEKDKQVWIVNPEGSLTPEKSGKSKEKHFICPVCSRTDFPVSLYLKRHLLSHYMEDFKKLYGGCNRTCPICSCVKCSHTDNMRHIAIVHDKLRTVMPQHVVDQLVANNVLAEKPNEESATALTPSTTTTTTTATIETPPPAPASAPPRSLALLVKPKDGPAKKFQLVVKTSQGSSKQDGDASKLERFILPSGSIATPPPISKLKIKLPEKKKEEEERAKSEEKVNETLDKVEEKKTDINKQPEATSADNKEAGLKVDSKAEGDAESQVKGDDDKIKNEKSSKAESAEGNNSKAEVPVLDPSVKIKMEIEDTPSGSDSCDNSGVLANSMRFRGRKRGKRQKKWTRVKIRKWKLLAAKSKALAEKNRLDFAQEQNGNQNVSDNQDKTQENEGQMEEDDQSLRLSLSPTVSEVLSTKSGPDESGREESVSSMCNGNGAEETNEDVNMPNEQQLQGAPQQEKKKRKYNRRKQQKCPNCDKKFLEGFDLCTHIVIVHCRYKLAALANLESLNGICPECGSKQRNEERFLQHLYVTHGKMRDAEVLSEEERAAFNIAIGDSRVKVDKAEKVDQVQNDDEKIEKVNDEAVEMPDEQAEEVKNGKSAIAPSFLKLKKSLFKSCKEKLRNQYPDLGKKCTFCPALFTKEDDCLKHVAFKHYRIFDFVEDKAVQSAILSASPACHVPTAGSSNFDCPVCHKFTTASVEELRVHTTVHFYQDLKLRMRSKPSGTFICSKATCYFDAIIHLGWEHGKMLEFITDVDTKKGILKLYSVAVAGCRAASNDLILSRPTLIEKVASVEQLLAHHGVHAIELDQYMLMNY